MNWLVDVYYKSAWWRKRSRECIEKASGVCEIAGCNNRAIQSHHLTYSGLWEEDDGMLLAVCGRCHMRLHGIVKPPTPANDNEPTLWDAMEMDRRKRA